MKTDRVNGICFLSRHGGPLETAVMAAAASELGPADAKNILRMFCDSNSQHTYIVTVPKNSVDVRYSGLILCEFIGVYASQIVGGHNGVFIQYRDNIKEVEFSVWKDDFKFSEGESQWQN